MDNNIINYVTIVVIKSNNAGTGNTLHRKLLFFIRFYCIPFTLYAGCKMEKKRKILRESEDIKQYAIPRLHLTPKVLIKSSRK